MPSTLLIPGRRIGCAQARLLRRNNGVADLSSHTNLDSTSLFQVSLRSGRVGSPERGFMITLSLARAP